MRLFGCVCPSVRTRESEKPKPKPRATRLPEQNLDEGAEALDEIDGRIKLTQTLDEFDGLITETLDEGAEAKNAIASSSSQDLSEKKKDSFLKEDEQIEKAKASSEEFSPKECIKEMLGILNKEEQIEKATAAASSLKKEKMQEAFVQVMFGDVRDYEDQKRVDSVWCPKNNMWVKEVSEPSPKGVKEDLGTSAAPEPEPEPEPPALTDWEIFSEFIEVLVDSPLQEELPHNQPRRPE